jgi:ABC-2 type transport system permease protein
MNATNPLRAIFSVAWKDIQILLKDRGFLVVILFLPSIFSVLFGSINQKSLDNSRVSITLPVALVNLDKGMYGEQIVKVLRGIEAFEIQNAGSQADAEQLVRDSRVMAAILIPAGLTDNVNGYQPSQIVVMIDPTQESYATVITGILREVVSPVVLVGELSYGIRTLLADYPLYQQADENTRRGFEAQSLAANMTAVQKMQADPWIKVEAKNSQGKDLIIVPDNIFAMVVPSFVVMFAFFIVGALGADLLKERQDGTLRRLMAAPLPRWTIITGKMLAYLGIVVAQATLIFGAASLIFDMPLGKSILGLLLLTIAMGLAATGLGIMIASISKTDRQADTTGTLLGFVLAGLGGSISFGLVPLYKSGGTLELVSKLTPHAHALNGFDMLMINNKGLLDVLPEIGILLGFALVFMLVATWRFRYE